MPVLWLVLTVCAPANPVRMPPEPEYVHQNWGVRDGLPQTTVRSILQAADGALWMATWGGLVRYDGVRFEVFDTANSPGLGSVRVTRLRASGDGGFWVGTEGGGLSRVRNAQVERVPLTGLDSPPSFIYDILPLEGERLLLGTESGVVIVDLRSGEAQRRLPPNMRDSLLIHALHASRDGQVLAATDKGLWVVDRATGNLSAFPGQSALPLSQFWTLFEDSRSRLWVGMPGALAVLRDGHLRTFSVRDGLPSDVINRVFEDSRGVIWVGTSRGLVRFNAPGEIIREDSLPPALRSTYITEIMEDREGSVWVGSEGDGLHRFRPSLAFTLPVSEALPPGENVTFASTASVYSVYEDPNGTLFFGSNCGGLYRYRDDRLQQFLQRDGLQSTCVTTTSGDEKSRLWVGTYGGGLHYMQKGRIHQWSRGALTAATDIFALLTDRQGRLWVGSSSGLHLWDGAGLRTWTEHEGLANRRVIHLSEGPDGSIWAGTMGGVSRLRDGHLKTWRAADGLPGEQVRVAYQQSDGTVWFGTYGAGLVRLRGGRMSVIHQAHGLPENIIHNIVEDESGYFWMGGNQGLTRVALAALNEVADGRRDRLEAIQLDEFDGLAHRELNGGCSPSAWRASDGRIWFASQAGPVVVDPRRSGNLVPPPVVIRTVRTGEQAYQLPGDTLRLPRGVRDFIIDFTAFSYFDPEKVRFRHRLSGPRPSPWGPVGKERQAEYMNMKPGVYTFELLARNDNGIWSEHPRMLRIDVPAHFHETAWFRAAGLLVCAGLLVVLLQARRRRVLQNERLLTEEVARQTRTLEQSRDQLQHLAGELASARDQAMAASQAKSQFLAAVSHEIRTPMNAVMGLTALMRDTPLNTEQQHYLELVESASASLLVLIDDLLDLSKIEAGKMRLNPSVFELEPLLESAVSLISARAAERHLELIYHPGPDLPERIEADPSRLRQILLNLLGNAVKFTEKGRVVLAAVRRGDCIEFAVEDTGIGIPAAKMPMLFGNFNQVDNGGGVLRGGTGLGLAISRQLARLMGGDITVTSEAGSGSVFFLRLPAPAARQPVRDNPGLRILVVVPALRTRTAAAAIAERFGKVVIAGDSAAAEACIGKNPPFDVVLVSQDVDMEVIGSLAPKSRVLVLGSSAAAPGRLAGPLLPSTLGRAILGSAAALDQLRRADSHGGSSVDPAPPRRVLLAEDNPVNRLVGARLLEKLNCQVDVVENGREAIEAARNSKYELIFMDCQMPVLDGLGATRAIRADPSIGHRPVIVAVTAAALAEDRRLCAEAGMDEYLSKPVTLEALRAVLRRWPPREPVLCSSILSPPRAS